MTDYPIKALILLLMYFLFITFITTIVINVSDEFNLDATNITKSGGIDAQTLLDAQTFVEYAGNPRFDGIRYADIKMPRFSLERNIQPAPMVSAGLILDEATCESYNGFDWQKKSFLGLDYGDPQCLGILNIEYYIGTPVPENYSFSLDGGVCVMPNVINDREVAESLGCTWYDVEYQQAIQIEEAESQKSFNSIWGGVKKIATFDIDFGLTDSLLNFILNFILIGLPALTLLIYIIIIVRKLVGFT